MSVPRGTRMGGIYTLEDLRIRCKVDEDTNCWHWVGACNQGRYPRFQLRHEDGSFKTHNAVRGALILAGREPKEGQVGFRRCRSHDCCNPAHMSVGPKAKQGALIRADGRQRGSPLRSAMNRRVSRAHLSKLTDELAKWIRESEQPGVELAHALGVSSKCISSVRLGKRWTQSVRGSSVFSWAAEL